MWIFEGGYDWFLLLITIGIVYLRLCVLPSDDGTVAGDSGGSH